MDKQQLIAKYGKKFASLDKSESVLKGVHYAAGGIVFVTNRHYGLRIRNAHQFEQSLTLDAKSATPIEGVYPPFERLIPTQCSNRIHFDARLLDSLVKRVACAEAIASTINKNIPLVKLKGVNDTVDLSTEHEELKLSFKSHFGNTESKDGNLSISLNAKYLLTALQLFRDSNKDIQIKLNGSMNPIVISDGIDIDVIILPYRTVN